MTATERKVEGSPLLAVSVSICLRTVLLCVIVSGQFNKSRRVHTAYAKQCGCNTTIYLLPKPVCTFKLHITFITHVTMPRPFPSFSLSPGLQPSPRSQWVSSRSTTWTSVQEGDSLASNLRPVLLGRAIWLCLCRPGLTLIDYYWTITSRNASRSVSMVQWKACSLFHTENLWNKSCSWLHVHYLVVNVLQSIKQFMFLNWRSLFLYLMCQGIFLPFLCWCDISLFCCWYSRTW